VAFTDDLLSGVSQYLADGGVGTWRPSGAYLATDPDPIVRTSVPASPDRVIVLTPYTVSDDGLMSDSVQGLQVRTRGTKDPRTVEAIDDAVFDRLHGAHGVSLPGGARLVMAERKSGTPLGTDGGGRHQRTSNYHLTVWRPSSHRT
jgi:hypothetical protein